MEELIESAQGLGLCLPLAVLSTRAEEAGL